MNARDLEKKLHALQKYTHHALVSMAQFKMILPNYAPDALKVRLNYLVKKEVLEKICTGVWAFPASQYYASTSILHLPHLIRPYSINYLSQESVLSKYSVISQQMFDYATVMTTGRGGTFKTPIGTLELTHTKRKPMAILEDTHEMNDYPLREASVRRAYLDLKHARRNIDMIDETELDYVIAEQEGHRGELEKH